MFFLTTIISVGTQVLVCPLSHTRWIISAQLCGCEQPTVAAFLHEAISIQYKNALGISWTDKFPSNSNKKGNRAVIITGIVTAAGIMCNVD